MNAVVMLDGMLLVTDKLVVRGPGRLVSSRGRNAHHLPSPPTTSHRAFGLLPHDPLPTNQINSGAPFPERRLRRGRFPARALTALVTKLGASALPFCSFPCKHCFNKHHE